MGRMSLRGTLPCSERFQKPLHTGVDLQAHLASGLVQAQVMPELILAHRARCVDLVAEDKERNLRELLDGEECVELRLGLSETLEVCTVNEEDDAINLGEVVAPEAASCCGKRVIMWDNETRYDITYPASDHPSRRS